MRTFIRKIWRLWETPYAVDTIHGNCLRNHYAIVGMTQKVNGLGQTIAECDPSLVSRLVKKVNELETRLAALEGREECNR